MNFGHDKFCEYHGEGTFYTRPCSCEHISKIRNDERQKSASRLISYLWESGMASYTYSGDMDDMVKAITMKEEEDG